MVHGRDHAGAGGRGVRVFNGDPVVIFVNFTPLIDDGLLFEGGRRDLEGGGRAGVGFDRGVPGSGCLQVVVDLYKEINRVLIAEFVRDFALVPAPMIRDKAGGVVSDTHRRVTAVIPFVADPLFIVGIHFYFEGPGSVGRIKFHDHLAVVVLDRSDGGIGIGVKTIFDRDSKTD